MHEFIHDCFTSTKFICDEDGCSASQEFNADTGSVVIPLAIAAGWAVGARSGVKFDSCSACTQRNNAAEPEKLNDRIDLDGVPF